MNKGAFIYYPRVSNNICTDLITKVKGKNSYLDVTKFRISYFLGIQEEREMQC